MLQGPAATAARFALSSVDGKRILKCPGIAERVAIIPYRTPALFYGQAKNIPQRGGEAEQALSGNVRGSGGRENPRFKKRLVRINIPHTRDHALIQQSRFHGRTAAGKGLLQVFRQVRNAPVQRFGAEAGPKIPVGQLFRTVYPAVAESPDVIKKKPPTAFEIENQPSVLERFRPFRMNEKTAGHFQVKQQQKRRFFRPFRPHVQNQKFRSTGYPLDNGVSQKRQQFFSGLQHFGMQHANGRYASALYLGRKSTRDGFYFGEFGHSSGVGLRVIGNEEDLRIMVSPKPRFRNGCLLR